MVDSNTMRAGRSMICNSMNLHQRHKESRLSPLLSVIVPLSNLGTATQESIDQLVELIPELTPRFELVVLADVAEDHRLESVRDCARRYPQIRLANAAEGPAAGPDLLKLAQGKTVIVIEPGAAILPSRLRDLWHARRIERNAGELAPKTLLNETPDWLHRLLQWGERVRVAAANGGLQLVQKSELERPQIEDLQQLVIEYRHDLPPAAAGGGFLSHLRDLTAR